MFENIVKFFKGLGRKDKGKESSDTAKERLHLVLVQDRANVSADFLELMKQEIIEVIKKYIDVDEKAIDVRLTNQKNDDGTVGAPALYANIPITTIKNEARKANGLDDKQEALKKEEAGKDQVDEKEQIEGKKQKEAETTKEGNDDKEKSEADKSSEDTKKKTASSNDNSKKKEDNETVKVKTATKSKTRGEEVKEENKKEIGKKVKELAKK